MYKVQHGCSWLQKEPFKSFNALRTSYEVFDGAFKHLISSCTLRLQDTGCMDMRCCAHNRLIMYCEQLAKNCSTVYFFLRYSQVWFHSNLGSKVISITFSRDWRELLVVSVTVSKLLHFKHARLRFGGKAETLFKSFQQPERLFKKVPISPSAVFVWWVY